MVWNLYFLHNLLVNAETKALDKWVCLFTGEANNLIRAISEAIAGEEI